MQALVLMCFSPLQCNDPVCDRYSGSFFVDSLMLVVDYEASYLQDPTEPKANLENVRHGCLHS